MTNESQKIVPNLWFDDDAEAAAEQYVSIFDDASLGDVTRYDESSAEAAGLPAGSVMTVSFELEGMRFLALNGGPQFTFTPAISFIVNCPTVAAVDELWAALSSDGTPLMPLDSYPFSDRFGWIQDTYGVSWQLIHAPETPARQITPSLLFVGDRCGQAEDAMEFYTSLFGDSEIGNVARYGPGQEPEKEGTIMHADFTLAGQPFAANDSAREHDFTFTEAISFVVDCEDQDEVNSFWSELTADGGEPGQCGWLTDRFGVSWQIVPTILPELLQTTDPEASKRVVEALLQMGKLDIEALEDAAESA